MEPNRIAWCVGTLLVLLACRPSLANPTGPSIVNGTASFASSGSTLTVTNSPNAIINWQTFSIGAGEITRFNQQSALSAVLNRVTTQNPSTILGALQSNGRIFLINPSGILFGAGSQVDVAGLVASTLNLSNADFLAGRLRFTSTPGAGSVVNNGTITSAGANAPIYLIGPAVTNGGIITGPRGEVLLAAGQTVEVAEPGTPNLRVEITAPDNEVLNLGTIFMQSGRVNLFGGIVRQNRRVSVDGDLFSDPDALTADARIVISASGKGQVIFSPESTTSARISTEADIPPGYPVEVTGSDIHVGGIVSSGPQRIDAGGALSLVSSPESRALLVAVNGQSIRAGSLVVSAQGQQASIENYGGAQVIDVKGDININTTGQVASIFGLFNDRQAISARNISIINTGDGGVAGSFILPGIQGSGSGDLTIRASEDLRLTVAEGAEPQSVVVGHDPSFAFEPAQVTLDIGGDLVLAGNGPRILASDLDSLLISTGGDIRLEGASAVQTQGALSLGSGRNIVQSPGAAITGNGLQISAGGNVDLAGLNQVATLRGTVKGDFNFRNLSPALTVQGLDVGRSGTLSLATSGDLIIDGDVSSGAQAIYASGSILISPSGPAGMTVHANGAQSLESGGDLTIQGGMGGNAFALVSSTRDIDLTVGGLLRLNAGAAPGSWARVQVLRPRAGIGLRFPNLSSGGWSVNGVADAVTQGDSGFFFGRDAAVLDESLFVTHGGE